VGAPDEPGERRKNQEVANLLEENLRWKTWDAIIKKALQYKTTRLF
jgi:hypothetical protein